MEAILQQAQAALNAERIEEAVEQCHRALQVDPNSAHAYYLLAVVEARRGARKEALQALLQAAKLDPSDVAVHLDLGKLYLQVDDHASATREFRRAIELGDPSGKGDYGLALVMIAKSRFGDALPHLRVAAGANPKDPERLLTLAATQLQLLQIAGSRETLRQIEDLPAPDPWFLYRLGNLLRDAKLPNAAQSAYERAIATLETPKGRASQDSRRPDLYLQAARLCFNHHDYWKALHYSQAVDTEKEDTNLRAAVLDMEGASHLGVGDTQKGREELARAMQLDASNPEYVLHLIWAELVSGDIDAALASQGVAEGKWPQAPEVRRMRTFLERERFPARAEIPYIEDWHVQGEGLVCCPCQVPCPCRSNARPQGGTAKTPAFSAWKEGITARSDWMAWFLRASVARWKLAGSLPR